MTFLVHPSSIIDEGAQIGEGTQIWHFCHVMPTAVIGARCSLGQNVFIGSHVVIGDKVKIQNNVSVYDGVTLEDEVFCGPSVVFTNVRTPRVAFPRNTREQFEKTLVKKGASLGANATIRCGVTIGAYALIGAGAVITRDVAPHAVMVGNPARQRGWACECGASLLGGAQASVFSCRECGRGYILQQGSLQKT